MRIFGNGDGCQDLIKDEPKGLTSGDRETTDTSCFICEPHQQQLDQIHWPVILPLQIVDQTKRKANSMLDVSPRKRASQGFGQDELSHVQHRFSTFIDQLESYHSDYDNAAKKREAQQALRQGFVCALQRLVKTYESISASKIWLYSERERALEQMGRLQELKSRQVQTQRRLRELLLKTDPNSTKQEIRAGSVQLNREAYLEIIHQTLETLEAQRVGYRELSCDYLKGLVEDAEIRAETIRFAQDYVNKAAEGFDHLLETSEALRLKVMEHYLARRHNTRLLKDSRDFTREQCRPLIQAAQAKLDQLAIRREVELDALKLAAEETQNARMTVLRKQVKSKKATLKEVKAHVDRVQDSYTEKVRKLRRELWSKMAEYEGVQRLRREGHEIFGRALREVRERLLLSEVGCQAEMMGMGSWMRGVFDMAQKGAGVLSSPPRGRFEGYDPGGSEQTDPFEVNEARADGDGIEESEVQLRMPDMRQEVEEVRLDGEEEEDGELRDGAPDDVEIEGGNDGSGDEEVDRVIRELRLIEAEHSGTEDNYQVP